MEDILEVYIAHRQVFWNIQQWEISILLKYYNMDNKG